MGTEYYLVKPDKKEIFYLGKHVNPLDCIKISASTADYIDCESFLDFFLDLLGNNYDGLVGSERTLDDVREFAYQLYEWCDDKVYFSNDCCDDFELFKDYKETGSIIKFCEEHPCHKEILDEFIASMPQYLVSTFEDGTTNYELSLYNLL